MEIRKLVRAGPSSHTIALPKDWITNNNLKKGDSVFIHRTQGNEIMVSTEHKSGTAKPREITVSLEDKKIDTVHRELASAYVNHYNTIYITGKDLFTKITELRAILNDFVALEITEQTATHIVAKDMLNLQEVSIDKTIRRMDIIVRSMFKDIIDAGEDMSQSINFRDYDVNRMYFLLIKIAKSSLRDPELAKMVGITNQTEILAVWYMVVNLEGISDSLKEIYTMNRLLEKETYYSEVTAACKELEGTYLEAVKAYYAQDKKLADTVASFRKKIIARCDMLAQTHPLPAMIRITENIKEIENSVCNIARIVLDRDV